MASTRVVALVTHEQVGGAMFTATSCEISFPNGATGHDGCSEQPPGVSGKVSSVNLTIPLNTPPEELRGHHQSRSPIVLHDYYPIVFYGRTQPRRLQ